MDLAERFNEASEALAARGHRVVVRRARSILGDGDASAAADFLADAGGRMRNTDLSGLADALRGWMAEGGDTAALLNDEAWTSGLNAEAKLADTMTRQFVAQQSIVENLGRSERAEPSREMAPSDMPPLPTRPEPAVRASAAIEERSQLEERKLELSDSPAPVDHEPSLSDSVDISQPSAAEVPAPEVAPQVEQPPVAREPSQSEAPQAPAEATQPTPSDDIMKTGFENLPQLDAPPSLTVPGPSKEQESGGMMALVATVLIIAGAVAGYLFLNR